MKKIAILTFLIGGLLFPGNSQEAADKKIQAGITLGAGMTFNTPRTTTVTSGVGSDLVAGMMLDWSFTKNIGLSIGLEFDFNGFRNEFLDSVYFAYDDKNILTKKEREKLGEEPFKSFLVTERKYKGNYLTVPLMLKFQTNYLGYFRYYGKFGLRNSFHLASNTNNQGEGKGEDGEWDGVKEIKDLKSKGLMNFYKGSVGITGGAEYNITGSTAIIAEIGYFYGFTELFRQGNVGKGNNLSLYRDKAKPSDPANPKLEDYSPSLKQGMLMLRVGVLF